LVVLIVTNTEERLISEALFRGSNDPALSPVTILWFPEQLSSQSKTVSFLNFMQLEKSDALEYSAMIATLFVKVPAEGNICS
jgi:hypothetical protein